jgi:hypothetical protein
MQVSSTSRGIAVGMIVTPSLLMIGAGMSMALSRCR